MDNSGSADVLPDVLAPGLKVVFCGMAAGTKSAQVGAYYAGPGNRFWPTLYTIGLTPRLLAPREFREVLRYGIGLTDMEKRQSGSDADLDFSKIDAGQMRDRIIKVAPDVLAFNSKTAAQQFFGRIGVDYGLQPDRLGDTLIWVLPSTSRRNAHWPKYAQHWTALGAFIRTRNR